METANDKKPLSPRTLRFSKGMLALSLFFLAAGCVLMMSSFKYALMSGVACSAVGFGIFFTVGYYWACENESCS
jgi:hypothetical protein